MRINSLSFKKNSCVIVSWLKIEYSFLNCCRLFINISNKYLSELSTACKKSFCPELKFISNFYSQTRTFNYHSFVVTIVYHWFLDLFIPVLSIFRLFFLFWSPPLDSIVNIYILIWYSYIHIEYLWSSIQVQVDSKFLLI